MDREPDRLRWKLCKNGIFSSRSFYHALKGVTGLQFPWKSIWGVKAPKRISFFVWTAAWGKILTCDNLMREEYSMAGWCCMCWCSGETGNHLLLHCNVASELWSFIFQSFGIHWVLARRVIDLLFGWRNWFGKHDSGVWNLVPLCSIWTLWMERNSCIFEDKPSSTDQLKGALVNSLFDWARVWGFTQLTLVTEFVDSLCFPSSS